MNIAAAQGPNNHPAAYGLEKKESRPEPTQEILATTPTPSGTPEDSSCCSEELPGVIRLLQAGHFKGVADVRLRLNFQDQLNSLNDQARQETAAAQADSFQADVSGRLEGLASLTPDDGQAAPTPEELESLSTALTEFKSTSGQFSSDPIEDMKSRFGNLLDAIKGFTAPPDEAVVPAPVTDSPEETAEPVQEPSEPGTEPGVEVQAAPGEPVEGPSAPVVEQTDEVPVQPLETEAAPEPAPPAFDWAGLAEELESMFNSWLSDAENELGSVSVLPELSPPSGNGKAYSKFLAMYQDAAGQSEPQAPASEEAGLDAVI